MVQRIRAGLVAVCAAVSGSCGGSDEPAAEPSVEALITLLCEKQAAVDCAKPDTEQRCLDDLHERVGFAEQEGCQPELHAYLKCASPAAVGCGTLTNGSEPSPYIDADCTDLNDAFFSCYTKLSPLCAVGLGVPGYTDIACTIKCAELSSLCHGPEGGPYTCTCDSGPRAGTPFQSTDCGGMGLIWGTGHHCTQ
ncbi:MAG: hypothetical protein IPI67_07665 [Myxococcales bacterium]|nr:hypothetical protein [Myxococcales bacterium]